MHIFTTGKSAFCASMNSNFTVTETLGEEGRRFSQKISFHLQLTVFFFQLPQPCPIADRQRWLLAGVVLRGEADHVQRSEAGSQDLSGALPNLSNKPDIRRSPAWPLDPLGEETGGPIAQCPAAPHRAHHANATAPHEVPGSHDPGRGRRAIHRN